MFYFFVDIVYSFSEQKNVGRVMGNEEAVVNVLKKGNLLDLQVVDTAKMSYSDQLKVRYMCLYFVAYVYEWPKRAVSSYFSVLVPLL